MRALLQRVAEASVEVDGRTVGRVGRGWLVLLGVRPGDDAAVAERMAAKVAKLRVFPDDEGRMNRSVLDAGGGALVVSQFTLYADARSGNRPGFSGAARPEEAEPLYERFVTALRGHGLEVGTGVFGAEMRVRLVNDGPVTIPLDSDELFG